MINVVAKRTATVSPLRYPGGKAALAGFLGEVLDAAGMQSPTYVEPFAGGAGAGLELLYADKVESIVINDLDPSIYAMWDAMVNRTDGFLERLDEVPLSVEEWRAQREVYRARDDVSTDRDALGFAAFYLNRTNRSGVLNAGIIGGQMQSGRYKVDARFTKSTLRRRIEALAERRQRVIVTCEDGIVALRRWLKADNVLAYVDPPYFDKGSFLYLNSFTEAQHGELSDVLNAHASSNWVLTYDNAPEIVAMYADRKQLTFNLNYSAHRREVAKELMVLSRPLGKFVQQASDSL